MISCPKCGAEALILEVKDTDTSSTKDLLDSPQYIRQLAAQCKVMGTTTAILCRMENLGNWRWVYRPKNPEKIAELVAEFGENWAEHPTITVFRVEFNQQEIDQFWAQFVARRDLFSRILETSALLPKHLAQWDTSMDWECGYCEHKGGLCQCA